MRTGEVALTAKDAAPERTSSFTVLMAAAYDEIADWYENDFLRPGDPIGVDASLRTLLAPGTGACLEIGCGTGIHAETVRDLGRTPIGIDLSAGMLRHASGRLPVGRADAVRLPVGDGSVPAVFAMMVHTDLPDYLAVLREVARVLQPGGVFVHVGVHPCFCGGFADRSDPDAVVIGPGYLDGSWTTKSWTDQGIRDKIGAWHLPLAGLLQAVLDAGLMIEQVVEGGPVTPMTLGLRAGRS